MLIRKMFFTGLLSLIIGQTTAGQPFEEMIYSKKKTVFRLFAPTNAKRIVVRLYADGLTGTPLKTVKMKSTGEIAFIRSRFQVSDEVKHPESLPVQ